MIFRELQADDVLPWSIPEIGFSPEQLDKRTVWVAADGEKIVGMIVAAEVHRTLLILRVLGTGPAWVRPLWRHIRLVCFHRNVSSFWTFADNEGEDQARLLQLVQKDGSAYATWKPKSAVVIAGRWNAPSSGTSPDPYGSGRGRNAGSDRVRVSESTWFGGFGRGTSGSAAETAASANDRGPENGIPGSTAERTSGDGRGTDLAGLQPGDGDGRGSAIRSKLYREIFGTADRRNE